MATEWSRVQQMAEELKSLKKALRRSQPAPPEDVNKHQRRAADGAWAARRAQLHCRELHLIYKLHRIAARGAAPYETHRRRRR